MTPELQWVDLGFFNFTVVYLVETFILKFDLSPGECDVV